MSPKSKLNLKYRCQFAFELLLYEPTPLAMGQLEMGD